MYNVCAFPTGAEDIAPSLTFRNSVCCVYVHVYISIFLVLTREYMA